MNGENEIIQTYNGPLGQLLIAADTLDSIENGIATKVSMIRDLCACRFDNVWQVSSCVVRA